MTPTEILNDFLQQFGQQLWMTFISFVITGFVLIMLKSFVQDLVNYFKARMSDIGRGQRIYFKGEILIIDNITFKHIEAHDDKRTIQIPISMYVDGVKEYPLPRFDDFDEVKYFQKPWDGKVDRRGK